MNFLKQTSTILVGNKIKKTYLLPLLLALIVVNTTQAEVSNFAALTMENDVFSGEDDGYTNGIAFDWGYAGFNKFDNSNTPEWIQWMSEDMYISTMPNKRRAITYQVAQGMVTPTDLEIKTVQLDDVPYAGSLTWKATQYAYDDNVTDTVSLLLGVVGPLSFADKAQEGVHELIDATKPEGWDHQLNNEPVFKLGVGRKWRLLSDNGNGSEMGYDIITLANAGVGNVSSEATVGVVFRFGTQLKRTYPAMSLLPGREVNPMSGAKFGSYYFFTGFGGRYQANNIIVNGNTFQDNGHNITLEHGQDMFVIGFSYSFGNWSILYSFASQSELVKEDIDGRNDFGSMSISWAFD